MHNRPSAATRNVGLIAQELSALGHVSPELWAMIIDEERTQASEILTHQEEAYAVVPRIYRQEGRSLVDCHDQDLITVIDDGVGEMRRQLLADVPGADWELKRREAERKNAGKILAMPSGTVCVEISGSPYDKPEAEREAQHYTNLTMVRMSYKTAQNQVFQYNYVLPVSSPEFLQAVQTKLGRKQEDQFMGSEELLRNPILEKVDQSPEMVAKRYDSLIGAALLEASVGQGAVRMIKKTIENRREAWEFINSEAQSDIDRELQTTMVQAAYLSPEEWGRAMDAIRSGYWKELKDRFCGNKTTVHGGGLLMAAAARAVVDGDVFIACGNTVLATEFATNSSNSSAALRAEIVKSLLEDVTGSGSCGACGAKGKLFGCGLCGGCNKRWCDIFVLTGKKTEIKDLAYLRYSRLTQESPTDKSETLAEYWERIGREIKQKREAKRAREEASKLEEENQLARMA